MYLTKELLESELRAGKSVPIIAEKFNKTINSVEYLKKKYHLRTYKYTVVCLTCGIEITGRKLKFCSRKCKAKYHGSYGNNAKAQYERGLKRKIQLILMLGGRCSKCGYNKNIAALCFHHLNQETKSFRLDMRKLSNNSMETLLSELRKCSLLCSNCHIELHHPKYNNALDSYYSS